MLRARVLHPDDPCPQVIIPGLTENYTAQADPDDDEGIPVCTLKMFPEETVHCIEQGATDRGGSGGSLEPPGRLS